MAAWCAWSAKNPNETTFSPLDSAGCSLLLSTSMPPSFIPSISGMLGPYMSASSSPTLAPACCSARARFSDTVDLPTPPLPLATPMTFLTVARPVSSSRERPSMTFAVTFMSKLFRPSSSPITRRTSSSISTLNGQAGVVSSSVNFRLPSISSMSFIIPIETMSFLRSGSITVSSLPITSPISTIPGKIRILYL